MDAGRTSTADDERAARRKIQTHADMTNLNDITNIAHSCKASTLRFICFSVSANTNDRSNTLTNIKIFAPLASLPAFVGPRGKSFMFGINLIVLFLHEGNSMKAMLTRRWFFGSLQIQSVVH